MGGRGLLTLLVVALLQLSCQADLGPLLDWQRRGDSGAYVSSGFHDWRGVSKYRSRPGLHAGYDIAMLPGAAVRTPWPGTVVAITPWYGAEVGVSLRLSNGWEATFGHITSSVRVGDTLGPGDLVGRVVVDHVDVKMRDSRGAYVDFQAHPVASQGVPIPPFAVSRPRDDAQILVAARAFSEYQELVSRLAQEEAQVRQGLLAAAAPAKVRTRLDKLRGLARDHAQRTGKDLPQRASVPTETEESRRPVTDLLLELD